MNSNDSVLILNGQQTLSLLENNELRIVGLVRDAYVTHARGESSLPHSTFLNFPQRARERIIALPAFLGGEFSVAGMKWIASFPENTAKGLDRASAVVILNSMETGRPQAIMEGAAISAKRTAASAALAAHVLSEQSHAAVTLIGCGPINLEIARFLVAVMPELGRFVLYDIDSMRAREQASKFRMLFPMIDISVVDDLQTALRGATLVSLATTAIEPHVMNLDACAAGATILHISLRDLEPNYILGCDNVTDDIDHVCRARTSLHLAEQLSGSRSFIRCTLAEVLTKREPARAGAGVTVFSPFGLGVLDLAVAQWVSAEAISKRIGTTVEMFGSQQSHSASAAVREAIVEAR
jgi:ornithine cyclodeaminase